MLLIYATENYYFIFCLNDTLVYKYMGIFARLNFFFGSGRALLIFVFFARETKLRNKEENVWPVLDLNESERVRSASELAEHYFKRALKKRNELSL